VSLLAASVAYNIGRLSVPMALGALAYWIVRQGQGRQAEGGSGTGFVVTGAVLGVLAAIWFVSVLATLE
jgi:hypothetical protein